MTPKRYGNGRLLKLCGGCLRFFDWRSSKWLGVFNVGGKRVEIRTCPCGQAHGHTVATEEGAAA